MQFFRLFRYVLCSLITLNTLSAQSRQSSFEQQSASQPLTIEGGQLQLKLNYADGKCAITALTVNGQPVITRIDGIYTSIQMGGKKYSSLSSRTKPTLKKQGSQWVLSPIVYGNKDLTVTESWTLYKNATGISWEISRQYSKPAQIEAVGEPVFNFDNMQTWEGAYQGYGGLAWFYLFNEKLNTYGVHTNTSTFWNSKTGNALQVRVTAPGRKVGMKYVRTQSDNLLYTVSTDTKDLVLNYDSGTHRRRFIRQKTDVWAPVEVDTGTTHTTIDLNYIDFNHRYGRGSYKGIDGRAVDGVLNTIARIGVIDSLHFGGNSWHTPYGPICLHEQYIADMGLAIGDPDYLKGYQSCLEFYCNHAIQPDGRVFARWAYTDEDMMPGQGNSYGFYEAQWGFLLDANPDLVSNISEVYNLTGDKRWVKRLQPACEKALDWIIQRDSNHNGLVEMINDSHKEHKSSDWIDIIWASFENAFVNAKLYLALSRWSLIEKDLGNQKRAEDYASFALKLKTSFNKSTTDGGFWDEKNQCYVHWRDKDGSIHGRNMVTPVNFMAIAYNICDSTRSQVILDKIERQMQKEKLFFWPLCLTSYEVGEGKPSQYPFPSYENGDLFLSWGSVGVASYAKYNPAIALKYVKNVLQQYKKDGLAFQRYGRVKQNGLGDDILSGNSLAIAGLYESIYGIQPKFNRFYLQPNLTAELYGTSLVYRYHGEPLQIELNDHQYSVSNNQ
ncbi:MAG TPA: hypothetical protein VL053_05585, partial [Arachidicoccus sp.]|nr:hypothetical protein [Arachidicoccus sp.]